MRILAIDPGTATTGYGVVEAAGGRLRALEWGALRTNARDPVPVRLAQLRDGLVQLLDRYGPSTMAVERLFFNRNVTSALAVGQARGVALLTAADHGVAVREFTPMQVKQAVTGLGRASKQQVGYMVKALLGLKEIPRPDDVADALALAICCAHFPAGWEEHVADPSRGDRL